MKRIILFLFILQFSLPGLAANSNNEHVDSLQLLLENSKETRSKVDLLNQLSFAYFAIGGEEAANNTKLTSTNAIKLSRKLRYNAGLAEALYHMGRYHLNVTDSYADATPCFLESLALFEEMNDKKALQNAICNWE